MTTIEVTTVRVSPKGAHLVQDCQGRQAWLLPKSLKDGRVNVKTFEANVHRKASTDQARAEHSAAVKAFRDSLHTVAVAWENEKCIGIDCWVEATSCEDVRTRKRAFVPMSQVKDGQVAGWLLIAKAREAAQQVQGHRNDVKYQVASIGGVELPETVYAETVGGW